ncbi:hypothetical protein BUALT_Bualt08G0119800 [Buddleja alternifolia]|uniref:Uncharacterized protein n=1 Tax=Buddleja alternifolia TaxID=168488 RepID=A0AAV6XC80_9LAMI|nr:hypothetical protein BUALT_Bualt08G0119800 [Buddleja alternifolia]
MNNEYYRDDRKCCYFHPKEVVIGVCALCLNERLIVLASHQNYTHTPKKSLPKIFALTTLLNRLDIKHHKSNDEVFHSSSTSPEDSFISIKFEDNGVASWDKGKISKMTHDQQCEMSKEIKSVVEHTKTRATLRWRRRIGHLFHVIRWKRSSKGNMCHVGTKLEGAKFKYGWIRNLTKRRTKE